MIVIYWGTLQALSSYFLVHFFIKVLKKINQILIIIQRSNGDVFLSSSLIQVLYEFYEMPQIDLLINEDTLPIAKTLPFVNKIITFSYKKKQISRYSQEKKIISSIFKKYDLSVNLTSSDRSVLYAILAGKKSISAVEKDPKKSCWKKKFLSLSYYFDSSKHILENNLESLKLLNINHNVIHELIPKFKTSGYILNISSPCAEKTRKNW